MTVDEIIKLLRDNSDSNRAKFQSRLCKTKYEIIGNTNPFIRGLAKELIKSNDYMDIIKADVNIYEFVLLQGVIIAYLKDVPLMEKHLNKVDDWGLCDTIVMKSKKDDYINALFKWIKSDKEFFTRYAIVAYMSVHLGKENAIQDDKFIKEIYKINHHEYYVDMAIAWFIQKLYFLDMEKAQAMLDNSNIDDFTKKKAIAKIKDSIREKQSRN